MAAINDSVRNQTNLSMALTSVEITTSLKPDQHVYNFTDYLVEQNELEYNIVAAFSDMQTVFLACIATLLPLIVAVVIGFGVRHAWQKCRHRRTETCELPWYHGICPRDDTADFLRHCSHSASISIQTTTRILSAQDLVECLNGPSYTCETGVMEGVALMTGDSAFASPENHTSNNANGNIITLTLKNNHLIVETEERTLSMEENSFVVEMQPKYINHDNKNTVSTDDCTRRVTDQQAFVHRQEIPEEYLEELGTMKLFGSINTGLSQSDLSISSHDSVNRGYRYGNQVEYEAGQFGSLWVENNYESDPMPYKLEDDFKWTKFDKTPDTEKILVNVSEHLDFTKNTNEYKKLDNTHNLSSSGSSFEQQDSIDATNLIATLMSNQNLHINGITPIKLESMSSKGLINDLCKLDCAKPVITGVLHKDEEEDSQEIQQSIHSEILEKLSINLDNTSLSLEDNNSTTRGENPGSSVFVPFYKKNGSNSSRPIEDSFGHDQETNIDIYSQIKTDTLTDLSPRFQLLQNEVCPIDVKES